MKKLFSLLMALCLRLFARHVSYIGIGVAGAVAHNMGQLGMAMLLLDDSLLYYSPWLLFLAVPAISATALLTGVGADKVYQEIYDILTK